MSKKNPAYKCYHSAKQRCCNPKATGYQNYGGRGIKFLFENFNHFLLCVGPRPSKYHTLERINNSGNYEWGNVRWATWSEQALNRRKRKNKLGISGVYPKSGRHSFIAQSNTTVLYIGPDFFEACCVRKSWECHQ